MNSLSNTLSPNKIKEALSYLPQFNLLTPVDAELWTESLIQNDSKYAYEAIRRLTGFGGLDISILVMGYMGLFHPFGDAKTVVRSKLLLDPVEPPNSHVRRSNGIIKLAKEEYREKLLGRGGKLRPDLMEKIEKYLKNPSKDLEWVIGNVDDIVEENGKIYLVDYKSPSKSQYEDAKTKKPLDNHIIQAHHYKILCNLAGVKIDGMRLFHFSSEEWSGTEQEVVHSIEMESKIKDVGNIFWQEFVMLGKIPPEVTINRPTTLEDLTLSVDGDDLNIVLDESNLFPSSEELMVVDGIEINVSKIQSIRQDLSEIGSKVFGQSLLRSQAESEREDLVKQIRDVLPMRALSPETTRIDLGQVRLKANWNYHELRLIDTVTGLLALNGQSKEVIEGVLASDNFHKKAEYSSELLLQILKEKKGIDVFSDPDFVPARISHDSWRVDTLVSFLRDLERNSGTKINWKDLIDFPNSNLTVELIRAPSIGFSRNLREQTVQSMREQINPIVESLGKEHVHLFLKEQRRLQLQEDCSVEKEETKENKVKSNTKNKKTPPI